MPIRFPLPLFFSPRLDGRFPHISHRPPPVAVSDATDQGGSPPVGSPPGLPRDRESAAGQGTLKEPSAPSGLCSGRIYVSWVWGFRRGSGLGLIFRQGDMRFCPGAPPGAWPIGGKKQISQQNDLLTWETGWGLEDYPPALSKAQGAGPSKGSEDQCCPLRSKPIAVKGSSRMPSANRTPEQEAREKIDEQLSSAGLESSRQDENRLQRGARARRS